VSHGSLVEIVGPIFLFFPAQELGSQPPARPPASRTHEHTNSPNPSVEVAALTDRQADLLPGADDDSELRTHTHGLSLEPLDAGGDCLDRLI
jgi:hypothetical protein